MLNSQNVDQLCRVMYANFVHNTRCVAETLFEKNTECCSPVFVDRQEWPLYTKNVMEALLFYRQDIGHLIRQDNNDET